MRLRFAVVMMLVSGLILAGGSAQSLAPLGGFAVSTKAATCPRTHPVSLTVEAETPDELPYLSQIDACTNFLGTQLWLRNRTDLVWIPFIQGGGTVSGMSFTADAFTKALGYPYVVMVPDAALVVNARPELVSWKFNLPMSGAWEARDYLYGWAVDAGLGWAFHNPRFRTGAAVVTCLQAVRNLVTFNVDGIANGTVTTSQFVSRALNTGVTTTACGKGLRQVAVDNQVRIPTFLDDLTSFDVTRLKQADALMARLTRYQRWQRLVLLFFS